MFQGVGYAGKKGDCLAAQSISMINQYACLFAARYESIFGVAVSINECFDVSLKMLPPLPTSLDYMSLEQKMHAKPERIDVLSTRYSWDGAQAMFQVGPRTKAPWKSMGALCALLIL